MTKHSTDLLSEAMEAKKQWENIINILKSDFYAQGKCLSNKIQRQNKTFSDIYKNFRISIFLSQVMLKEVLQQKEHDLR